MSETNRKKIVIPEICRVEGHSAVSVTIADGQVSEVKLDVFEGTRFFEQIVLGHHFDQIPHITSRVCAICSTGHVLAAIFAIEKIFGYEPSAATTLLRELMHLGMIIESHATHICALALPDFLSTPNLKSFASCYPSEFAIWGSLRNLGAMIQTTVGGRPFHPVNLKPGGFAHHPREELNQVKKLLSDNMENALTLCEILLNLKMPFVHTYQSPYLCLKQDQPHYGYFGNEIISSEGWQSPVNDYKKYMAEHVALPSHAKLSTVSGKPFMVGSIARLHFYADKLGKSALQIYERSSLAREPHTVLNNLAQGIELVDAIERAQLIIDELLQSSGDDDPPAESKAGCATGAVECPRGTLYHYYELDEEGTILSADMITPSAQNAARIEKDISVVAQDHLQCEDDSLRSHLETLVRAYDPCNTCATHMVKLTYA